MERFPLIETWHGKTKGGAGRPQVTSEHETVFEARKARAAALGVHVQEVMGRKLTPDS